MASSEAAPEDNHQARMARYLDSASSIVLESLYCLQRRLCWSCMSNLINFCVCHFNDVVQLRRQVRSWFSMGSFRSPLPLMIRTTFQLAYVLSAMKPLKLVFSTPFFAMRSLSFLHMIHCTFVSSDCMSHMAMVMTLQYAASTSRNQCLVQPAKI
jgi:hypothetical protein